MKMLHCLLVLGLLLAACKSEDKASPAEESVEMEQPETVEEDRRSEEESDLEFIEPEKQTSPPGGANEPKNQSVNLPPPPDKRQNKDEPFFVWSEEGAAGEGEIPAEPVRIERRRVNSLNLDHLNITEYATISLVNTIDEEGKIISVTLVKSKTTTTNMEIINPVMGAVQEQLRYNKDPGAPPVGMPLDVKITPN